MGFIRKLFGFKKKHKYCGGGGGQNGDPNVLGLHDGEQQAIFPRKVHLRKDSEDAHASAPSPAQQRPASADAAAMRRANNKSFSGSLKRGSFLPPSTPQHPSAAPQAKMPVQQDEAKDSEETVSAPHALPSDRSHLTSDFLQPNRDPSVEELHDDFMEVPGEPLTTAPVMPPIPPPRRNSIPAAATGANTRMPKVLKTSSLTTPSMAPTIPSHPPGSQAVTGTSRARDLSSSTGGKAATQPTPQMQEVSSSVVCSLGELDAMDSPRVCETKARIITDHVAHDATSSSKRLPRMSFLPDDDASPKSCDPVGVPAGMQHSATSVPPPQPSSSGMSAESRMHGASDRRPVQPQRHDQQQQKQQQQQHNQMQQQQQQRIQQKKQKEQAEQLKHEQQQKQRAQQEQEQQQQQQQQLKQQQQQLKQQQQQQQQQQQKQQEKVEAPKPQAPIPPPRSSNTSRAPAAFVIPDLQADEACMFSPETTGCSGWRMQPPQDEAASGAETEMSPSRYGSRRGSFRVEDHAASDAATTQTAWRDSPRGGADELPPMPAIPHGISPWYQEAPVAANSYGGTIPAGVGDYTYGDCVPVPPQPAWEAPAAPSLAPGAVGGWGEPEPAARAPQAEGKSGGSGRGGSVLVEGCVAKLQKKKKEFVDKYITLSVKSSEEVGDGEDRQGVDFCYLIEVYQSKEGCEGDAQPDERVHVTGAAVKFVQGTVFTVKTTADLNKKALTHFLSTNTVDEARSWLEALEMVPDCTVDWVGNEGISLQA